MSWGGRRRVLVGARALARRHRLAHWQDGIALGRANVSGATAGEGWLRALTSHARHSGVGPFAVRRGTLEGAVGVVDLAQQQRRRALRGRRGEGARDVALAVGSRRLEEHEAAALGLHLHANRRKARLASWMRVRASASARARVSGRGRGRGRGHRSEFRGIGRAGRATAARVGLGSGSGTRLGSGPE